MATKFVSAVTIAGILAWENECRKRGIAYRPSVGLAKVASFAKAAWRTLGEMAARVGNQVLGNLDELYVTSLELAKPIVDTATSPFHFYLGYMQTVMNYKYPILATVGSAAVGLAVVGVLKNRGNILDSTAGLFSRRAANAVSESVLSFH